MSSNSTSSVIPGTSSGENTTLYHFIGIALAVASGGFIGCSFVFKKKGLLSSMKKSGAEAGEGHAYLKSPLWWTGMTLMILGEFCNFVAYAFTPAILVTPLGALSVVLTAILSSIFLKERLNFQGKVGCALSIIGAVVIVLNAPQQQASDSKISTFEKLALAPGFLFYVAFAVVVSLLLAFVAAPRWGKTNMLVYISICSLIGSLSVTCTQGLGSAIVYSISTENQFNTWFPYFLIAFVVVTLLTEINFLNKALNLFNTALVTPTYYVLFTGLTIIASAVLYRGFQAPAVAIVDVVMGFFTICCGILLLQAAKSEDVKAVVETDVSLLDPKHTAINDTNDENNYEPGAAEVFANPFNSLHRIGRGLTMRKHTEKAELRSRRSAFSRHRRMTIRPRDRANTYSPGYDDGEWNNLRPSQTMPPLPNRDYPFKGMGQGSATANDRQQSWTEGDDDEINKPYVYELPAMSRIPRTPEEEPLNPNRTFTAAGDPELNAPAATATNSVTPSLTHTKPSTDDNAGMNPYFTQSDVLNSALNPVPRFSSSPESFRSQDTSIKRYQLRDEAPRPIPPPPTHTDNTSGDIASPEKVAHTEA